MIVRVELRGQHFQVELVWDRVPGGGWGWWMKSIDGDPRPRGKDVRGIYRGALELAERAMRADRSAR